MISATEVQRHIADLTYFETSLINIGLTTNLVKPTTEYPIPLLAVAMPKEYAGPPAEMQLMYHSADSLLEETAMLQIHLYLLEALPIEPAKLTALINKINTESMMGYYGIDKTAMLYYRYVYALPRFIVPEEAAFLEIMTLLIGNFSEVATILMKVSKGEFDDQV